MFYNVSGNCSMAMYVEISIWQLFLIYSFFWLDFTLHLHSIGNDGDFQVFITNYTIFTIGK
jgi:hypothetical protein